MNALVKAGQDNWEKFKRTKVDEKSTFIILFIGIIIILIPMLVIAKYDVPCADDYNYGLLTHLEWEQSHSILNVLKKSVQQVKQSYFDWQGTYSAVFAFSLQPAIFGEEWYPLTTFIMLISLCGGISYLFIIVFRQILNATWYQTGIVTIALLAICTQLLPSPVEAFYWYNGSVYYTFFWGISLVLYAKVLMYIRLSDTVLSPVKRILRLLSLSILSAIIAGTNYVIALTTAILFTCVLVYILIQKKYSCLVGLVFPFFVFVVGFITNIMAPGNSVRQSYFPNHPSALFSIFRSFKDAIYYTHRWLTPSLILLAMFLVPLLFKIAAKTSYSYSYPFLTSFGSFCLYASLFCPSEYAMGTPGPGRLLNIIYFAFVILLVFNLFYILGWCKRTAEKRGIGIKTETQENKGERSVYSMVFLLVVLMIFLSGIQYHTYGFALKSLRKGEARTYYDTAMERLDLLKDDSQQDVVLPRYSVKPEILYFNDITEDSTAVSNVNMSNYYQKNSVILESEE